MPLASLVGFVLQLVIAAVRGVITGVAVSAPTGPVNVAVIRHGISASVRLGVLVGAGAAVVDALYSLLAWIGLVPLVARVPWVEPLLAGLGSVLLVLYGATSVFRPLQRDARLQRPQTAQARAFGLGVLMTLANPGPLLAWVGIAGATMVGLRLAEAVLFSLGVFVGGVLWFWLLATLAHRGTVRSGTRATWVTRLVGVLLIGFGIYLGVRAVIKTLTLH